MATNLFSGGVKSIQYGNIAPSSTSNVTISIATVNPSKCFVQLLPSVTMSGDANGGTTYTPILVSISSTSFVVTSHYTSVNGSNTYRALSWQIVEFV